MAYTCTNCDTQCASSCTLLCTGSCEASCKGSSTISTASENPDRLYPITRDQLQPILNMLKKELYRRSGFHENGSYIHDSIFRNYNQPIFDKPHDELFVISEDSDEVIRVKHGKRIIDQLIEICDVEDLRIVNAFDVIPGAFDKKALREFIELLQEEDFNSPTTHCRSACTGLCINACTMTCVGSCVGYCADCSSNCVGECSATCSGCTTTCGSACGVSCGMSCTTEITACAGCYSGCNACTACTDACFGSCLGCTTGCEATCMGGCSGNATGQSSSCGCGSTCTTGCGRTATSVATSAGTYSITFYNDQKIMTVKYVVTNGSFTTPSISDLDNVFTPSGITPVWTDSDGNTFAQGATVRFAGSVSQYNTLKSAGISCTMQRIIYTKIARIPMTKWSLDTRNIDWALEPEMEARVYPGDNRPISVEITLENATQIDISVSGFTGKSNATKGVTIDGVYAILPYSYAHPKGTKIKIYGVTNYTFMKRVISPQSNAYTLKKHKNVAVVPRAFLREYKELGDGKIYYGQQFDCEVKDNPYAWVTVDGGRINGPHVESEVTEVSTEVKPLFDIGATGRYHGLQYGITFEEYHNENPHIFYIYGNKDATHNVFVRKSFTTKVRGALSDVDIAYKIPLIQSAADIGTDKYTFTIPSASTMGFLMPVPFLVATGMFGDETAVANDRKFEFGKTYTVHARQDFYLYPFIKSTYTEEA